MRPSGDPTTWGDIARERARSQGLLYYADVRDEVARILGEASPDARRAFALACAERAMAWHLQLPPSEQRGFTLAWRPILDAIRAGFRGDLGASATVRSALDAFHSSPYDHSDGPDRPDEADEDAAAAAIYAAECFLSGEAKPAEWAAGRIVDIQMVEAERELELDLPGPDDLARENIHPRVQTELRLQLDDLAALSRGRLATVLDRPIA
jgi:hypothetical protein